MKRLILLLALLLPGSAWADGWFFDSGVVCGVTDSNATGGTDLVLGSGSANTTYRAGSLVSATAGNYTLKSLSVKLKKTGSPTFNVEVFLCTSDVNKHPVTCTSLGSIASSSLTTSYVSRKFSYPTGYAIATGTRYVIQLLAASVGDVSNHVRVEYNASGTERVSGSDNGSAWSDLDSTSQIVFEGSTCE